LRLPSDCQGSREYDFHGDSPDRIEQHGCRTIGRWLILPADPMPLVSIIIRNFNYGSFLKDALDSALAQTYREVEVIVVDDGSTDNSREILRDYQDRCRIVLQQNGGEGAAVNVGFRHARGVIILYLDADDVLFPATVSTVVAVWAPAVARVHFRGWIMSADGRLFGAAVPSFEVPSLSLEEQLEQFGEAVSGSQSCNAYAAWALRRILPLAANEWIRSPDAYLNALTTAQGETRLIQSPLVACRRHARNLSLGNSQSVAHRDHIVLVHPRQNEAVRRLIGDDRWAKVKLCYPTTHWLHRILCFRLNPHHPFAGDRLTSLMVAAARAIAHRPHINISRQIFLFCGMLVMAAMPRAVLRRLLQVLLYAARRTAMPRAVSHGTPIPGETEVRHWRLIHGVDSMGRPRQVAGGTRVDAA
jgi:glycosyltransferase involved in cell wall biosynthesis